MPTVNETLNLPGGTATRTQVKYYLAGVGGRKLSEGYTITDETIVFEAVVVPNEDGETTIDLVSNANIVPANTVYARKVGDADPVYISVPDSAGPFDLADILAYPPGTLPSAVGAGVQSVIAGANITVDNTDPANPIIIGVDGESAVASVNGQVGIVVLDAEDVGAASDSDLDTLSAQVDDIDDDLTIVETGLSTLTATVSGKLDDVMAGTNVTIDKTDPNNPVISAEGGGGGGGAVDSVNGQTGVVVLDAADVGAASEGEFDTLSALVDDIDADLTTLETNVGVISDDLDTAETKLATIETNADVTDQANVIAAGAMIGIDAGSDLSTARPASAIAVYWLFDNGIDPGTDGANIVNAVEGDTFYVRAS